VRSDPRRPVSDHCPELNPAGAPARSDRSERGGRSSRPITVSLVNDYEVVVRGLHAMLSPYPDRILVVEHEVGSTPDRPADVALFDTFASRRHSLGLAAVMIAEARVRHVVIYTWDAPARLLQLADQVGVSGVVLKSTTGEHLVRVIERIVDGERVRLDHVAKAPRESSPVMSQREREVLALLARGRSNREIAEELFLSVDTVKTYLRRLFDKLQVANRTQAALRAVEFELAPRMCHALAAEGD
jgi:DNA-binding NarL/FixJ family response regulator